MRLHRDYISTIINTLVGKPFRDWVDRKCEERNQKIEEKQNMVVQMDPEIATILNNSNTVSGK